jgi:hypothetical protein
MVPPPPALHAEVAAAAACRLEPAAFFPSWHGVLTLAFAGFPPPLAGLKRRLSAAHPSLPPEAPGSLWPKCSLGCLRDGAALDEAQFAAVRAAAAALDVSAATVFLYESRSLERLLSAVAVELRGGGGALSEAPPDEAERARVRRIVGEADDPGYWLLAAKEGHREAHYCSPAPRPGATLAVPLAGGSASLHAAIAALRARVDAAAPGAYRWFDDDSLHVTLRALVL